MSLPITEQNLDHPAIDALSDSERYDLLASKRRRLAVDTLATVELPIRLDELARAVDEAETAAGLRPVPVEDVKISLHHAHLPKLDDANVLDYDPTTRRITEPQQERNAHAVTKQQ